MNDRSRRPLSLSLSLSLSVSLVRSPYGLVHALFTYTGVHVGAFGHLCHLSRGHTNKRICGHRIVDSFIGNSAQFLAGAYAARIVSQRENMEENP